MNEMTLIALRIQVEKGCDPDAYERLAEIFEHSDRPAAGQRCRQRAQHYRNMQTSGNMQGRMGTEDGTV